MLDETLNANGPRLFAADRRRSGVISTIALARGEAATLAAGAGHDVSSPTGAVKPLATVRHPPFIACVVWHGTVGIRRIRRTVKVDMPIHPGSGLAPPWSRRSAMSSVSGPRTKSSTGRWVPGTVLHVIARTRWRLARGGGRQLRVPGWGTEHRISDVGDRTAGDGAAVRFRFTPGLPVIPRLVGLVLGSVAGRFGGGHCRGRQSDGGHQRARWTPGAVAIL